MWDRPTVEFVYPSIDTPRTAESLYALTRPHARRRPRPRKSSLRACFEIGRGSAARDFGRGRGGEAGASPQRAVRAEPTKAPAKRPAAQRVFAKKAFWLRCSSLTDRRGVCSLVAPRQKAFFAKTGPRRISKQALRSKRRRRRDRGRRCARSSFGSGESSCHSDTHWDPEPTRSSSSSSSISFSSRSWGVEDEDETEDDGWFGQASVNGQLPRPSAHAEVP